MARRKAITSHWSPSISEVSRKAVRAQTAALDFLLRRMNVEFQNLPQFLGLKKNGSKQKQASSPTPFPAPANSPRLPQRARFEQAA